MRLNVLYQSSDLYAPLTGIAMTSLFENNKDIENIVVYLMDDGISENNKTLLRKTADKYKRTLNFISTEIIRDKLVDMGVASFKGSYTTYYKLFVSKYIKDIEDVNTLLYMDSDTLVDASIKDILSIDLNGKIAAARIDLVPDAYKTALGMDENLPYYNCGVILFNMQEWIQNRCEEQIVDSIINKRTKYSLADQDLLCTLFSDKFAVLGLEYNFPSMLYMFSPKECYKVYDLKESTFYSIEEMRKAYASPKIQHTLTHFGKRPWHKNSGHPQEMFFFKYAKISEWSNYQRKDDRRSIIFVLQEIAYRIFPKKVYIILHKEMLKVYLNKRDANYKKKRNSCG